MKEEKKEIIIKEDWKGEAIKAVIERIGYGIDAGDATNIIEKITDSVCKIDINYDPTRSN